MQHNKLADAIDLGRWEEETSHSNEQQNSSFQAEENIRYIIFFYQNICELLARIRQNSSSKSVCKLLSEFPHACIWHWSLETGFPDDVCINLPHIVLLLLGKHPYSEASGGESGRQVPLQMLGNGTGNTKYDANPCRNVQKIIIFYHLLFP